MPTVTGVSVPAQLADIATSNIAPTVTTGDVMPMDTEGWVVMVQFDSAVTIADPTKLTVNINRPGYSNIVGSAPITRADVAYGTKQLRRATPNVSAIMVPGSANAFYIQLDNLLHASDVITSCVFATGFFTGQVAPITIGAGLVTRADTLTYAPPIIRPAFLPYRRIGASGIMQVEFAVIHEWAAFGQQVARVEARGKSAGAYGPWAGSGTQAKSAQTSPPSGRNPSGLAFDSFTFNIDVSTLADGAAEVVFRAFGWFGDVIWDSETDGTAFPTFDAPATWPIVIDKLGNHTPIYVWVNANGVIGASPAVQTSTADPGSAGSYTGFHTALTAARAYNNANRGHNTTSGAIIMLRDIAGGVLGGTGHYWQRASLSSYSDGLVPPVICSATYLTTGLPNLNCRVRGVQDDGVTIPAIGIKYFAGRFEYRGLTLDSSNQTGGGAQIFDGQAGSTTAQQMLVDCDIRCLTASGVSTPIYRPLYRYDIRVDEGGLGVGEGPGNSGTWGRMVLSVGSNYAVDATFAAKTMALSCGLALQMSNHAIGNSGENNIYYGVRVDGDGKTSTLFAFANATNTRVIKGMGICNVLVRCVNPSSSPAFSLAADNTLTELRNAVAQHMTVTGQRSNTFYQDQGWIYIEKRGSMRYCVMASQNNKSDYFFAPEVPSSLASGWATATAYLRGRIVHDNNATAGSRIYYQAKVDHTSGATQATDLANSALWQVGAVGATAFGAQPRRMGNWRFRNAVRSWGNVFATSSADTVISSTSYYGEVLGRGSAVQTSPEAAFYKARSLAFSPPGDYRPISVLGGDGADSPVLNRVPAGQGVTPNDLYGNPRRQDGGGAAGALERSDAIASPVLAGPAVRVAVLGQARPLAAAQQLVTVAARVPPLVKQASVTVRVLLLGQAARVGPLVKPGAITAYVAGEPYETPAIRVVVADPEFTEGVS